MIDLSNDKDSATILTVIDKYDKCVVLGLGGRGKSALLKELERKYAHEYPEKGYLPFSLSPEDIWSKGLIETIKLHCEENGVHIPSRTFEKYSTHQPFLLLIDGVEILSKEERKILSHDLQGYRHYRDSLTVTGVQGLNLSLKLCSPQHVSITVSRNPFFQFLI
ncbi:MAG: NACHT domain-containing protein, partial [Candidatus Electrothrix sp. AUS1_2]|nr:NACHT domain-containing protein [Candidatus Electrothrix sp. AUS1_2]